MSDVDDVDLGRVEFREDSSHDRSELHMAAMAGSCGFMEKNRSSLFIGFFENHQRNSPLLDARFTFSLAMI